MKGIQGMGLLSLVVGGFPNRIFDKLGALVVLVRRGGNVRPIYTDHARDQMADRGITEEEVEFCLNEPEITRSGERDALILTAHPNGRLIKIVVSKKKPRLIITVGD